MKIEFAVLALAAVTLGAIATGTMLVHSRQSAPVAPTERLFQVKGQVQDVDAPAKTIRIAHEDIPGFMPAMEMPFAVKDASLLNGLKSGDQIQFRLVVTKDDSWITAIQKLAHQPESSPSDKRSSIPAAAALEPGAQVPDFTLLDQEGRTIHLRDFRGKAVVLTFIYTRCPLPNYCPLMSKNFSDLQERFRKACPGKVQLLSVSFDPDFDTPATLSRYAAAFQHGDKDWLFACGSHEQVDRVTAMFGLVREPAQGFINHDLRTALISPSGKLVHIWRSNFWTPYEVERMTREALQPAFVSAR